MVKIIVEDQWIKEISFPCLMKGIDSGTIILCQDANRGTVLYAKNDIYTTGDIVTHISNFALYKGKITLENSEK